MKIISKSSIVVSIVIICFMVIVGGGIFTFLGHQGNINAKLSYSPQNLDDLIQNSEIIIKGKATQLQEEFKYDDIEFYKTQVEIKDVIKGQSILKNENITILQTNIEEDPIIEKNGEVILFLEKYEGPIIKDAYVCKGLFKGHYKITNSKVFSSSSKNELDNNFSNELNTNDSVEKFIERIKTKVKN